jgi:hypothetical protein
MTMQSTASLFGVAAGSKRRFLTNFVQLQIAMSLGALVCYVIGRLIPASSSFASVYYPGGYLFTAADVLFLVTPVVAWMLSRGYGWRHGIEMAIAMIAPVAAISVIGELAGYAYRPWLITAGYPAMSLGMLAYMFYRAQGPERASASTTRPSRMSLHTLTGSHERRTR